MCAELLSQQDASLTAQQRETLSTPMSSGKGLLALLNDVLDFAKMESGRLTLEEASFSLSELLHDANEQAKALAHGNANTQSLSLPQTEIPACVRGDQLRLRQVLANLLSNAHKFTTSGKVVLRVSWLS